MHITIDKVINKERDARHANNVEDPVTLEDHPEFFVKGFAPKFRINENLKDVEGWRQATKSEFLSINEILRATELKLNTKVAFVNGHFTKQS